MKLSDLTQCNNTLETVKFGVRDVCVAPFTSNEFCEKPCSKIHILLKDINDFVSIMFIFLGQFRQYLVLEICPHCSYEIVSFVRTHAGKWALYLRAQKNSYP
jgi:hypothetical protein